MLFTLFMFASCNIKEVNIVPGTVYYVSTTRGDGFAIFEHTPDNKWIGLYYSSDGRLMAEKCSVSVKVGDGLSLIDDVDSEIPILSYSLYEEPEFENYPETWTYLDSTYSVTLNKDVVYGSAQGYWTSYPDKGASLEEILGAKTDELKRGERNLDLTMDVYLPNDNKEATRPLLVLIHGGAFFNGDKADLGFPEWANYFASLGYVVASVNYRLGFHLNEKSILRAGYRGVQDVDAAIRYIIHHKDTFWVDPDRVFVAGTSAGAITALNVAFMKNENIPSEIQGEGNIKAVNPDIEESYYIRAVGNMWGGVNDLSILSNAPSSVISFHGTGDPIVPFAKGCPFKQSVVSWFIAPTMYGSEKITEFLGDKRAILYPYEVDTHTLYIDYKDGTRTLNSRFFEIEEAMSCYFSAVMQPSPVVASHLDSSQTFQVVSSEIDSVYWRVEGGGILKQYDSKVDVLLFPDVPSHSVTVCGKYKSGLTFRYKWEL